MFCDLVILSTDAFQVTRMVTLSLSLYIYIYWIRTGETADIVYVFVERTKPTYTYSVLLVTWIYA